MKQVMNIGELHELLEKFDTVFDPSLSVDVPDLKQYAEKLAENADTFVIEEKNMSAGFISFYANDDKEEHSFIVLLAVLPEFQGKRLAQKLLDRCMIESTNKNKKGVKLEVMKDNYSAVRFYERNNFKVSEETGRGSVYMIRTLL